MTVEATNNPFHSFRETLNEMGFSEQAEAALVHTQCEAVEHAVTFILHNMGAIWHRFEGGSGASIGQICSLCNEPYDHHLVDADGNKVAIGLNEENYNHEDAVVLEEGYGDDGDDESVQIVINGKPANSIGSLWAERGASSRNELAAIDFLESIKKSESAISALSALEPAPTYDGPTEQCLICFDEKPIDYFSKTECGHDLYCKECLTEHYRVKTKDGDVLKVKCIDPRCEREIKEEEILSFLCDDEIREKFIKFKRRKLLMLNENARFCPAADCEGFMIGSRIKPKLECPECGTAVCFNCSKLWHGYFTKCSLS